MTYAAWLPELDVTVSSSEVYRYTVLQDVSYKVVLSGFHRARDLLFVSAARIQIKAITSWMRRIFLQ